MTYLGTRKNYQLVSVLRDFRLISIAIVKRKKVSKLKLAEKLAN